jgi:hypothetical protein
VIVYCRTTKDTAKLLAADLGIPCYNPHGGEVNGKSKYVIRWGTGAGLGYIPEIVVNKKAAVRKAVNKLGSIKLFNDNGIRTAPFSTTTPCVGRSIEHTQGQNFWLCWAPDQVHTAKMEGAEYFIDYIPIKQEYRIHVMDGEVVFTQRKYPKDRVSSAFMGIQGFSNGWHKHAFDGEVSEDIIKTAKNAVAALGLDFGGVDILISQTDNLAYVAEVNTGPALPTEEVRKFYTEYFTKKLGL